MAGSSRENNARLRVTRLTNHVVGKKLVVRDASDERSSGDTSTSSTAGSGVRVVGRPRHDRVGSVVVVGGSVLDVHLTCDKVVPGSTVPGKVKFQHGGVGRNIVECLGRLGEKPLFVSAVGGDAAGREILGALESLGVSTKGVKVCQGRTTPTVACSFDGSGNLTSGVADTALVESELRGEWIMRFREDIKLADLLVLEANLTHESLHTCFSIAREAKVPVFFEPVSVTKSLRVVPFLSDVSYFSPNEAELKAVAAAAGESRRSFVSHEVAADVAFLKSRGVQNILVTRGEAGVYSSSRDGETRVLPSLKVPIVNVNGAGDCLVAGVLKALVGSGKRSLEYAVSYGIAVACAAIQTPANVPNISSEEEIDANALQVFSTSARVSS
ncbi:PfkB-like carbohydrate/purine kinase [Chloropicon primus]|uniref:PfkB-like carbohydrate/purine kinase n=2 Tax=Chloropicon primus TaxID=1764295 RepID=A0A5B8MF98_9CHLO|nr:PfkB-like carbohydrate/purine kinase [Chloropicon primus]UPQ98169.1 PfkB-like carbohydrate/purine kinase [Chloropicon primus]|eukprot:QDZ18961.1 PfkB-like carbohydrate/purine kinase [Chloropicon primus]